MNDIEPLGSNLLKYIEQSPAGNGVFLSTVHSDSSRLIQQFNHLNICSVLPAEDLVSFIYILSEDLATQSTDFEQLYSRLSIGGMLCIRPPAEQAEFIDTLEAFCHDNQINYCVFDLHLVIFKANPRLLAFKDIHKGERVFLIGNGPSLKDTDLEAIQSFPSIAMNRIELIYKHTSWRPTYYVYCSDNVNNKTWGKDWTDSVQKAVAEPSTTAFVWQKYIHALKPGQKPVVIERMTEEAIGASYTFSDNASQWLSKTGTTLNVAMQLACYMGFKEIIILGADLNWQTSNSLGGDPNHFDPSYSANIPDGENERRKMLLTHYIAYQALLQAGKHVYNATLRTFVDTYPLISFDKAVNKKAIALHHEDEELPEIIAMRKGISAYWRQDQLLCSLNSEPSAKHLSKAPFFHDLIERIGKIEKRMNEPKYIFKKIRASLKRKFKSD